MSGMWSPRLIKVSCPQCGAGMRIDAKASVVTCSYCRVSSFVHLPNRPDPPAPAGNTQGYRHIHVQANAVKTVGVVFALIFIVPFVAIAATVAVIFGGVFWSFSRPPPPRPMPVMTPAGGGGSASCDKAVACCKAVMSTTGGANNRTCEALRALDDNECAKQAKTFADSARQLGKRCD